MCLYFGVYAGHHHFLRKSQLATTFCPITRNLGGLLGGLRLQPDFRRHRFRPRHQRVGVGRVAQIGGIGHLLGKPLRVLARVQAVGLGCDRDRVHLRRRLGAARRAAEQVVLAAYHERLDAVLGEVVVEW